MDDPCMRAQCFSSTTITDCELLCLFCVPFFCIRRNGAVVEIAAVVTLVAVGMGISAGMQTWGFVFCCVCDYCL